jgi:serine/threonine protein kinase
MQMSRLCFILPSESVEIEPVDHDRVIEIELVDHDQVNVPETKESPRHRHCSTQIAALLRHSVHRFLDSKWLNFWSFCHPNRQNSGSFHDMDGVQFVEKVGGDNPRTFSYAELYIGSNGFSSKEVLGSGGFGRVYKAVLPSDGTTVAVKCLAERGERFEKTFAAELVAVAHLRHRNLVRLRGWCVHDDQLLLVYDYMPNRSLDRVLFRRPESKVLPLSWERRRKIVSGLAGALYYLHEQLETQIIHRDVKTSNVMLDSHYNAKLGDFGLARWLEHELEFEIRTPSMKKFSQFRLAETTRIGGTIGYLPPESFQRRSVTTAKSDVFSFGIVVLEVVSGRRAVDLTYQDDKIVLLDWIRCLADDKNLLEAGDSRLLDGSYKLSEMERLIHIGLLCTLHEPQSRPNMKWVVEALSGHFQSLPDLPSYKSHPLYIAISSSQNSSTSNTRTPTTATATATTETSSPTTTTFGIAATSSNYVTATGETMYVTAENENGETRPSSNWRRQDSRPFLMIETPREISFKELVLATDNFSDSRQVAELDFGTAYHGVLENNEHILVKRLGMKTCPALRARFSNELENLGRLRHRNLVQLRGWCTEQGEMLVIYDYSSNCLLSNRLFFHHDRSVIKWNDRYKIVKSLASAIHYLHEEWEEQVIHRNITSSAVILDSDTNPRLTCFALAEFLTRNEDGHHVVIDKKSATRGIFGYMSPESMESDDATTMADVYSFGVVILEVVTGQMAVDFRRPEVLLVRRVQEFEAKDKPYIELADRRLDGEYNHEELTRLVKLGMACTRSNPKKRPSMKEILRILDGHDDGHFLEEFGQKKEGMEEWKEKNDTSLRLVRRIQALGIQ